jgi:RNA polymerase sigma-70 factor (ECF subfamily)
MNKNLSEQHLVIGLLNDDESAFCELYALYKRRLIYCALRFVKSKELAEDVFQDAFALVWQNRRFLNPNLPFVPYIYDYKESYLESAGRYG